MGATRIVVPGERREHFVVVASSSSSAVMSSASSGDLIVQASGVIETVDDSYVHADAERCSTSRIREEASMVVLR
jgi:hypothetical protein